jgi:hypothetical protein
LCRLVVWCVARGTAQQQQQGESRQCEHTADIKGFTLPPVRSHVLCARQQLIMGGCYRAHVHVGHGGGIQFPAAAAATFNACRGHASGWHGMGWISANQSTNHTHTLPAALSQVLGMAVDCKASVLLTDETYGKAFQVGGWMGGWTAGWV